MKPCTLCHAALPDDAQIAPGALFCGACGRNTEQVRQSPSLPPGAVPYQWPPPVGQQPWGVPPQGPPGYQNPAGTAPPGLNWGAFLLPFIWGPANRVSIGLLALVGFIPLGITQLVSLGVSIYLLMKGNELAWTSGRVWQSEPQFRAVQKAWAIWGLMAAGVLIVLSILSSIAYMAQYQNGGNQYYTGQ